MSSTKCQEKELNKNENSQWVSPWTLLLRAIIRQKERNGSPAAREKCELREEGSGAAKLLLSLALSGLLACSLATQAQARDYFVATTGNNSDGLTPQTAWNELDQIKWELMKDGDMIKIAGGTYHKTLKINFQTAHPPQFFLAGQPGYGVGISPAGNNDKVIIEGSPTNRVGVDFGNSRGVILAAYSCDRLIIEKCPLAGVQFGPQSSKCFLFDAQVQNNLYGLRMDGDGNQIFWSDIHDNVQNVAVLNTLSQPGKVAAFMNDWIHNTKAKYTSYGIYAVSPVLTQLAVANCVVGPGLNTGILMSGGSPKLEAANCLFLNNINYNVRAYARTYTADAISLYQCTSYLTQLNALNRPHAAIALNSGTVNLIQNIFYQGVVNLPPAAVQVSGLGNVAFKTTGTPIPGVTVDPDLKGVLPGARLNNASMSDLVDSDYRANNKSLPQPVPQSITSWAQLKPFLYR